MPTKSSPSSDGKGKLATYVVDHLDGTQLRFELAKDAKGSEVFEAVTKSLQLFEVDYFDLSYTDRHGLTKWLTRGERVRKQLNGADRTLRFRVKFYPTDPAKLEDDLTRYLLCLQVHSDIVAERLPCSFYTYALLASYFLQAHVGDFDSPKLQTISDYIGKLQLADEQPDLIAAIKNMHKERKGQTPVEAEMNYLENAKKLSLYGVELHDASSEATGEPVKLGICATGVLVYADRLRLHRFAWQRIYKVSYFRNHFNVLIHADNGKATAKYVLASSRHAKAVWKSCVAHHVFFRLMTPGTPSKHGFFRFGSMRLHYAGRTQYQTRLASATCPRPPPRFQRSFRGIYLPTSTAEVPPTTSQQQQEDRTSTVKEEDSGKDWMARNGPPPPAVAAAATNCMGTSNSSVSSSVGADTEGRSVLIETYEIPESKYERLHYEESNVSDMASTAANGGSLSRQEDYSPKRMVLDVPATVVTGAGDDHQLTDEEIGQLIALDDDDRDNDLYLLKSIYAVTGLDPKRCAVNVRASVECVQTETEV